MVTLVYTLPRIDLIDWLCYCVACLVRRKKRVTRYQPLKNLHTRSRLAQNSP